MRIDGSELTSCEVMPSGDAVRLDLLDTAGRRVSLSLPFAQAQALTMTLPRLLTFALKAQARDDSARFVFPLGSWRLEAAVQSTLIMTLGTPDGFEVSFSLPHEECWTLACALRADAEWAQDRATVN